jgi:hypothetical protein
MHQVGATGIEEEDDDDDFARRVYYSVLYDSLSKYRQFYKER